MKRFAVLGSVLCLLAGAALAQEQHGHQGTPQETAAMEAMMKASTPGDAHKALDALIGTWEAEVTFWIDPTQPPSVSKATSEHRWVLGGRWIEQRFRGEFAGAPFEGLGYIGYDNVKKKYVSSWMDTMSTWMMTGEGEATGEGKVTFRGRSFDPMQGKEIEMEDRLSIVDRDHVMGEMFSPGPDGKPVKVMEIHYKRKK